MKMELRIEHTWDGLPVSHDPVAIALQSYDAGLLMQVSAPFFNDPPAPLAAPGKPFRKLWDYEGINKFNAFAIHGSGDHRKYEALYPVPRHKLREGQKPDFHRLEFFQEFNLKELMGEDWKQPESDIWKSHTK